MRIEGRPAYCNPFAAGGRWGALAIGVLLVVWGGCNQHRTLTLSPPERLALHNRALDLLLLAADNNMEDVSCNAIEALVRVAPRDGLPAFRRALRSDSPLVRYAGLVALGEVRDRDWLDLMVAGVRDPSPRVRVAAAFAACRCGKDGYARLLVGTLTDNPDENLRADAAYLIGRLADPRAEKWLRAALRYPANEKSNRVTLYVNWALAMLGHADAVRALIRNSQSDAASADALLIVADLGHPDSRDALRYRLGGASEEHVEPRLIAARGLGRLGLSDGFKLALETINYVDRNPHPDDPQRTMRVRSLAAHALGEIGDPRALGALRKLAESREDPRVQVAACYAICRILDRYPPPPTRRSTAFQE